ncbi:LysR family transcriptional regulator [Jannaschia sp. S6380]|uniref:LysR family transcriptional regulator n=1 Tax=Jannaschia sp. S6380 TaxID=2926408 RepID=UPI001FF338D4|nr:LysR family transcriptional regulator [Jannaschia sp. S6380]MCK0168290.1 LysR family transcriptional regulator [Jannaschia sp. S6380]
MIKFDSIRVFTTVAHHGNLRAAAQELGRTQSALSMTLKQLETDLGGPLFETDRKRDLTDLGRFVKDVGDRMVRDHDACLATIRAYSRGEAGQLRIASVPSVAALILPELLSSFMKIHPDVRVDLMDSDSAAVRDEVASGHADIGIADNSMESSGIRSRPLFSDTLFVICKPTDILASRGEGLTWADLWRGALIVNETIRSVGSDETVALVEGSRMSARNNLSLLAMVASGAGITVLPGLATRSLPETIVALPLTGSGTTRTISLLTQRSRTASPVVSAFCRHAEATLPRIGRNLGLRLHV